jgi:hypothetical protein
LLELQTKVKRNAEAIEKVHNDLCAQMDRVESTNAIRFTNLKNTTASNEAKLDQITASIEALLKIHEKKPVSSHGDMNYNKPPFQVRSLKIDFPRFDGKNVLDSIFKAEQFFAYYNTPDTDRLVIASVHLDKDVVPWFQMIQRSHPFHSWQDFTQALEMEFGPSAYECPRATLFKLTQTNSVREYYKEFTALANRVYGLSTEAILDCFISGLNVEIRRDVLALSPRISKTI